MLANHIALCIPTRDRSLGRYSLFSSGLHCSLHSVRTLASETQVLPAAHCPRRSPRGIWSILLDIIWADVAVASADRVHSIAPLWLSLPGTRSRIPMRAFDMAPTDQDDCADIQSEATKMRVAALARYCGYRYVPAITRSDEVKWYVQSRESLGSKGALGSAASQSYNCDGRCPQLLSALLRLCPNRITNVTRLNAPMPVRYHCRTVTLHHWNDRTTALCPGDFTALRGLLDNVDRQRGLVSYRGRFAQSFSSYFPSTFSVVLEYRVEYEPCSSARKTAAWHPHLFFYLCYSAFQPSMRNRGRTAKSRQLSCPTRSALLL